MISRFYAKYVILINVEETKLFDWKNYYAMRIVKDPEGFFNCEGDWNNSIIPVDYKKYTLS